MRKGRLVVVGSLLLLISALRCSIPDLPSEGGACPCAPGYTCDTGKNVCVQGGDAVSTSATVGGGGHAGTGGVGGSGGSGGAGVGACGGASAWKMDGGVDWSSYACTIATPNCGVQPDHVLCCDNVHPIDARDGPSVEATFVGTLTSSHSWFVCWLRGETQKNGNAIWYYTSLDMPPSSWGYVAGSSLEPDGSSTFDPADPTGSNLPNCPCP